MKLQITIITQHHHSLKQAEELGNLLLNELGENTMLQSIKPYTKFIDSYSIHLEKTIPAGNASVEIHQAIAIADHLVSPWLSYFDSDSQKIELIYNHTDQTQKRKPIFNEIRWAQLIH
ncbi:hypothetical protein [Sediminibacterium sp.]|uniref:hypothetical protein n=1 Tax=Sediminibacterium sp. TaxID=1917865 RepID=UPI002736C62A|nr:hypothetical protein [Sediminibacterium sp.]MDP3394243.1 hypothetical protein [Sediminibacterium sp.]MDP3567067.1 hypothetical protein [Sediminibacterium sp.]